MHPSGCIAFLYLFDFVDLGSRIGFQRIGVIYNADFTPLTDPHVSSDDLFRNCIFQINLICFDAFSNRQYTRFSAKEAGDPGDKSAAGFMIFYRHMTAANTPDLTGRAARNTDIDLLCIQ